MDITGGGTVTIVAGPGRLSGYVADGQPATSGGLLNPTGLAVDAAGDLYLAVVGYHHRVRKVNIATGIVTTVAGTQSVEGYNGDDQAATAAWLDHPVDVAVDTAGNLYIADLNNHRVRKVGTTTGMTTTVAGTGAAGYSGDDGPAARARIDTPYGIEFDAAGNMYIADGENTDDRDNHRVRKVIFSDE